MSSPSSDDHAEDRFRLQEHLRELDPMEVTLDFSELAEEYRLPVDEVEAVWAAVQALPRTARAAANLPDDFEIEEELGRGGMGIVYRAHQRSLDRQVALKVLPPGDHLFERARKRFENEARHLGRLRHPHIVSVHQVGRVEGTIFYTMDLVEGVSLADRLKADSLLEQKIEWLCQVAEAMSHAHQEGIVHRDLKPQNILIDGDDQARVVDFGLARDLASTEGLTLTGHLLGTPTYMSPEQARGEHEMVGERSDVYALGAVLYQCLAGRPPFEAPTMAAMLEAVAMGDPRPPHQHATEVPGDLEIICLKALARDPERRYRTMRALLLDLRRYQRGEPIEARGPNVWYRSRRWLQRHRWRLVEAGAGAIVAMVVLVAVLMQLEDDASELLSEARWLQQEGELRGSAVLYGEALEVAGWPGDGGEPASTEWQRAYEGWARGRLSWATEEFQAGEIGTARKLLEQTLERTSRVQPQPLDATTRASLQTGLAACHLAADEDEYAKRILHGLGSDHDWGVVCERLEDFVVVSGDLGTTPGARVFRHLLEQPATGAEVLDWWRLRSQPEPLLQAILATVGAEASDELAGALDQLILGTYDERRDELDEILGRHWSAEAQGRRALARYLLIRSLDLPWFPTLEDAADAGPERAPSLLSLSRSVDRRSAYRRRVDRAIGRLEGAEVMPLIERLLGWLELHLGRPFESREEAVAWWEQHRDEDPRSWLGSVAGSDVMEADGLRELPLPRAAWLHYWLTLSAPSNVETPRWAPTRDEAVPSRLVGKWRSVLRN